MIKSNLSNLKHRKVTYNQITKIKKFENPDLCLHYHNNCSSGYDNGDGGGDGELLNFLDFE